MTTPAQRLQLHEMMRQLLLNEPRVHYAQERPMETVKMAWPAALKRAQTTGLTMDCSEAATALCHWAGMKDPNGLDYNGAGYTGTLLRHLPHYSRPSSASTGALVVFGPGDGDHVCTVMEPGANPLLFSHGQERGPIAIRFATERQFQRAPFTFLSIARL